MVITFFVVCVVMCIASNVSKTFNVRAAFRIQCAAINLIFSLPSAVKKRNEPSSFNGMPRSRSHFWLCIKSFKYNIMNLGACKTLFSLPLHHSAVQVFVPFKICSLSLSLIFCVMHLNVIASGSLCCATHWHSMVLFEKSIVMINAKNENDGRARSITQLDYRQLSFHHPPAAHKQSNNPFI